MDVVYCVNPNIHMDILYYNHSKGTAGPPSEGRGRTGKHLNRPPLPSERAGLLSEGRGRSGEHQTIRPPLTAKITQEVHKMNVDTIRVAVYPLILKRKGA